MLSLAGMAILMGIIIAEALYPAAYRTSANTISDLGGTRPPDSVVLQPSAAIFDITMIVAGLLIIAGAYLGRRALGRAVAVLTRPARRRRDRRRRIPGEHRNASAVRDACLHWPAGWLPRSALPLPARLLRYLAATTRGYHAQRHSWSPRSGSTGRPSPSSARAASSAGSRTRSCSGW